jgi:hypothetical protein
VANQLTHRPASTSIFPSRPGIRGSAALVCLLLGYTPLARAGGQAGVDPAASPSPAAPQPAGQPGAKPLSHPELRAQTLEWEPGRFNLSIDGGLGLIRAASPYTLKAGQVAAAVTALNTDRNPGDTDLYEYSLQGAVGLPWQTELFVKASPWYRSNSVNLDPRGYPVPPLDLFVDTYPTRAERSPPYFLFTQEVPFKSYYLNAVVIRPPPHGAFGASSGDVTVGGKVNVLSEDRGSPLGLGVRAYVEIPTESPSYNVEDWRHVAGVPGQVDVGWNVLLARRIGQFEVIGNVGLKHVGDPSEVLRVQLVDSSRWGSPGFIVGAPVDATLDLRNQLTMNVGSSMRLINLKGMQFWLLGELGYLRYVGGGTQVERTINPFEARIGAQGNVPGFPRISIGAALQVMLSWASNGDTRRSNFHTPDERGDINFTRQVDAALNDEVTALFTAQGATFRERSSRMFATDNPAFDQWRNVPTTYQEVTALGNANLVAFITWRIN